jgi:ATP-dependent Clp protease ATP-binding subunit ClpC
MLDQFTDKARKAMTMANEEAMRLNHEYISTEHILLGLVKIGSGNAVDVMKNLNCDLRSIRIEVEKRVSAICQQVDIMELPPTPRAKNVVRFAIEEMGNLNQNEVGTEHLLLGLLREDGGIAAKALMALGLDLEKVRNEVQRLPDGEEN